MTFLYPLGLLGLIGVPIIVIIYILKNKFNEQTVPSTYLWRLSEKFFKRRNPLSGLTGLISLILQILAVVVLSLLISRPIFMLPESAGEYCFVLDASGSMHMESGGRTRFVRAKEEIGNLIGDASAGSTYTLVCVAGETSVTYERITDKKLALDMLEEVECTDGEVEYSDALAAAQRYFDKNPSFMVYLFTDGEVGEHESVEVVNVASEQEKNCAIGNVKGSFLGGELTVNATVISYGEERDLTVSLYVDGGERPAQTVSVLARAGESTPVTLSCRTETYEYFRVAIEERDSLAADNEIVSYNLKNESSYSVLIVSDTPFFLEAALDVLTDATVDTVKPSAYTGKEGYGLYIFHSYAPESLPDAAVWMINVSENVKDSGFGARGVIELDAPATLEKTGSTATVAKRLLSGVSGRDVYISEYVKYSGMYTRFTTLFTHNANPVIFAGVNGLGNREVVIGFDLHRSDLALSSDFVPLIGNLLSYSCPDILSRAEYVCGEDVEIGLTASIKNVKVISPDGEELYVDTTGDVGVFTAERVGTYTVELLAAGAPKSYRIYSGSPEGESDPVQTQERFSLAGEREYERSDGEFDPFVILLVSLVLIFTADWMVYCYEKYQLR